MSNMKRREFIKVAGAAGAATGLGLMGMPMKAAAGGGHVIVIGGGYGGTIAPAQLTPPDWHVRSLAELAAAVERAWAGAGARSS